MVFNQADDTSSKKTEMEFALLHKLLTLQEVGLGD